MYSRPYVYQLHSQAQAMPCPYAQGGSRGGRPAMVIMPSVSMLTTWSLEALAVSLASGSVASGLIPLQADITSLRRTCACTHASLAYLTLHKACACMWHCYTHLSDSQPCIKHRLAHVVTLLTSAAARWPHARNFQKPKISDMMAAN